VAYPGFYAQRLILSVLVMPLDRSVGIATGCGIDDRGSRARFLAGARDFALLHNVQTDSGRWEKRQEREADYSSSSSVEVKNGGAIPPVFRTSSWFLSKHKENIGFYLNEI
jgi:hypothetical protein